MSKLKNSTTKSTDTPTKTTRLSDEIDAEKPRYRRGSKVEYVISQLNETDRVDFDTAMRDQSIPTAVIARVIRRRGLQISESAIYAHRKALHGI